MTLVYMNTEIYFRLFFANISSIEAHRLGAREDQGTLKSQEKQLKNRRV